MRKHVRQCEIAAAVFAAASMIGVARAADDLAGDKGAAAPQIVAPQPTDEVIVFFNPGVDRAAVARQFGAAINRGLKSDSNAVVLKAPSVAAAQAIAQALSHDGRIHRAYVNRITPHTKFSFVPNDPYFHRDTPSSGFPGQWHLTNEFVTNRDVRAQGAWNRDYTGSGVKIGIVDDGLQWAHPDLQPNYNATDSWDFGEDNADPTPVYSSTSNESLRDDHGTAVSGVAAARGGNGIGVTGAAPFANLSGLRCDFIGGGPDDQFVDATLFHSSGANTSLKVKNHSYGISYPYIETSAERDAFETSAAAGTIHCLAAGNDRGSFGQDSNKKHIQSSPDVITIAALGSNGTYSSYSCFGACVFVTAPSNGSSFAITTTDRTGNMGYNTTTSGTDSPHTFIDSFPDVDYNSVFGGTSSASPLVAGVMALAKQAQPALDVRLAKHLLVRTSDIVDAGDVTATSDGGWKTNAAGFKFNQNYGFGLVDAEELTRVAVQYSGVTAPTTTDVDFTEVNANIPDNNTTGVTRSFSIGTTEPLEEVLVTLGVTHTYRGDIEATLTSPSGTSSRLMIRSASDGNPDIDWTFCSNTFWGENPSGTWSLKLADTFSADVGTWDSYSVEMRQGSPILFVQWATGSGKWSSLANWTNGTIPNGVGATATFLTRNGLSPATVTLTSPVTVGTLKFFNHDAGYDIVGPVAFTIDNGGSNALINLAAGSHTISAPLTIAGNTEVTAGANTLFLNGAQTWGAAKTLGLQSGTILYTITSSASSVGAGATLRIDAGATVALAGTVDPLSDGTNHVNVVNNSTSSLWVKTGTKNVGAISGVGKTRVDSGALLVASSVRQNELLLNGNARVRPSGGASGTSRVGTLTIDPNRSLDLTNNKLIVTGLSAATVEGMVLAGRNGGAWNGSGIITSMTEAAGSLPLATLAVASASQAGKTNFGGISVAPTDALVMYTWLGDLNFNGGIDGDDFFRLDTGFGSALSGYLNGDLNYSGGIDVDDYWLMDRNYSRHLTPFSASTPLGAVAVPEPSSLMAFSLVVGSLARRRRPR